MPDFTGVNWTAFAILIAEYVTGSTSTAENGLLETTITYPVGGSSTRELADVKNSGSIDVADYIEVLRHVTGIAAAAYSAYLDNFVKNHLVTTSAWATITAPVSGVQTLIVSNNVSSANPSMVRNSPTTMVLNVGDMWIDSFNKNQLYRFDGTNWVKSQDTTVADNIYVSNTTTIDGGTISAGTKITAGTSPNVGVLDGTDNSSGGDGPWRIYAGHATAASAPFRVNQNGTVTIEQSTDAGKLVIEGDVIKVYTTSGGVDTLRVKLGNLA